MNFYRKYIGDFQRDTRRLSLLEKGAYNELLDMLYATEQPLPLEHRELYRACGCESTADRKAVDRVIADYFEKTEVGYTQPRAIVEIEKTADRRTKNKENGKQGGRPPKAESVSEIETETKPNGLSEETESVSETKAIQYPLTINQEKDLDQNTFVPGKPATPDCPHQEIIDLYHRHCPTMPQVKIWNESRRKALQARWRESPKHQSLDFWNRYLEYAGSSPLLRGDKGDWRADLEWLVTAKNFAKVVEGKYENREGASHENTGRGSNGNPQRDNSAAGRVAANIARDRAEREAAAAGFDREPVAPDGSPVRPQVDQPVFGSGGPGQRVGRVLEGDFSRADSIRHE